MSHFSQKKLINLLLSIFLIGVVAYVNPEGSPLKSFQNNISKNYYFDTCSLSKATSTPQLFHIVLVIDGDTLEISKNCKAVKVRLIGINTPETVDPKRPVECFGREASDYTKKVLEGKDVSIQTDPTQEQYDKYGRLLGYVILQDGTNFNKEVISQGYGYEYTYGKAYVYQNEFKKAQEEARQNGRGLWSPTTCNGKK